MSSLFGHTGFFTYIFDGKCFAKANARRFYRMSHLLSTEDLWSAARKARNLKDGIAEELLVELSKRKDS